MPGYMLLLWYTRVIAIMVTRIFSASRTEIRQNDDMHCSARAIRLIMERLPWRPQIKPGSAAAWGLLRAKKNSNRCHFLKKGCFLSENVMRCSAGWSQDLLIYTKESAACRKKIIGTTLQFTLTWTIKIYFILGQVGCNPCCLYKRKGRDGNWSYWFQCHYQLCLSTSVPFPQLVLDRFFGRGWS